MKTYFFPLFSLFLILFSCSSNHEPKEPIISEEDSLKYIQEILVDLKEEAYNHPSYGQEFPEDIIFCGERPIFTIRMNKKEEIMVQSEIGASIYHKTLWYFEHCLIKNDLTSNAVMYSQLTKDELDNQIKNAKEEYQLAKSTPDLAEDFLEFKRNQLADWEKKSLFFKYTDSVFLREPSSHAAVDIDYPLDTRVELIDSVLPVYYTLRENAAKRYFNTSYVRLHADTSKVAKEKIIVLSVLHPINIVDRHYCKKNNIPHYSIQTDLPPPPPLYLEE